MASPRPLGSLPSLFDQSLVLKVEPSSEDGSSDLSDFLGVDLPPLFSLPYDPPPPLRYKYFLPDHPLNRHKSNLRDVIMLSFALGDGVSRRDFFGEVSLVFFEFQDDVRQFMASGPGWSTLPLPCSRALLRNATTP